MGDISRPQLAVYVAAAIAIALVGAQRRLRSAGATVELRLELHDALLGLRQATLEVAVDPARLVELADQQHAAIDEGDDGFLV